MTHLTHLTERQNVFEQIKEFCSSSIPVLWDSFQAFQYLRFISRFSAA